VYVKSLTLRGFKSFASATTLRLEPGITCIVGPNGSGKSNVVDALAWVMGEQGAKSLRGGKMEDVVFAWTTGRPPLGRAEVSMTIDNTDGALPIDYTEVTITRTMFRNGGSDYSINGTSCRLLDIQELLSDSGIGREMHVIVGQGQLDQVLRATPEERRGFIEEAAGVLKHRKRKERALRKLETMDLNLTRLGDLTTEIRRQLGPLGRQAETARRAVGIQADVRDARLRLLADDLSIATNELSGEIAAEAALRERRALCEEALRGVSADVEAAEAQSAETAPALSAAQDTFYAASALVERLQSTHDLATERARLMASEVDGAASSPAHAAGGGRDPEQLLAQAASVRAEEARLGDLVTEAAEALQIAEAARRDAEAAHSAEQSRIATALQAASDRREGLARLAGQVAARRSRLEAEEAELGRLRGAEDGIVARAQAAQQQFAALEVSIAAAEDGEEGLDEAYEAAEEARGQAQERLDEWRESLREAQNRVSSLQARCEALEMSLLRKDGGAALMESGEGAAIRGTLSSMISVDAGYEAHIAAALGWAGEALVLDSFAQAAAGLDWLREHEQGQVALIIADGADDASGTTSPPMDTLPHGATWATDVVTATLDSVIAALRHHLRGVVLVTTTEQAHEFVQADTSRDCVAVTADGDVYGATWARGGSSTGPSAIEIESALEQARSARDVATADVERAGFELAGHTETHARATTAAQRALDELHQSDASMAAVAEQLGQLGSSLSGAHAERDRTQASIAKAVTSIEVGQGELRELEQRLARAHEDAQASSDTQQPCAAAGELVDTRAELAEAAARARTAETEARLTLRTGEERANALSGRAQSLEAAARNEASARQKAQARARQREQDLAVAAAVADAAEYLVGCTVEMAAQANARRNALAEAQTQRDQRLIAARARSRDLSDQLRDLTSSVHQDEIARAGQRLRIETLHARSLDEHGLEPETLLREYGPDQLIPVLDPTTGVQAQDGDVSGEADVVPFVRAEQEKRLRSAERKLTSLGRVNPLALEEFAALEERHTFLTSQVDDLRRSKADLLDIVKEVDERVERVFAEAFADTAAQFEGVFSRLFPGGEGRLILTEPDNMLTTGIEVEARPPGKKIKRLSLLSGGERSLTAVALLVSIFKARPSPFYIMDEVEAALDDTNLGRLITLFEELRDSSQLIVITHQKRTMEVADALYGVSMQGDGVTTVISQRLREQESTPA